jgi:hypothetical protein
MDINANYSEEDNPVALKADFILSLCELSFLVCKHRHSGVAETANPGSGNRESGNAETAIAVMSYGCRI